MNQETIHIPTVGAVFWAEAMPMPDGSAGVRAIAGALPAIQVTLDKATLSAALKLGITYVQDIRGLVFASRPNQPVPPTLSTVAGIAQPLDGRFHPRQFSVAPTPKAPSYVPLRPSLLGTSIGEAGAVAINLQWQGTKTGAASWSVVSLTCIRNGVSLGFTGQADVNGDVIVPLTGLPPLPATQTSDSMTLTVRGDATQSGADVGNPDALQPVPVSTGSGFAAQQTLAVVRGQFSTAALKFTLQSS
jgi:hypothetical protein